MAALGPALRQWPRRATSWRGRARASEPDFNEIVNTYADRARAEIAAAVVG